jgi:hypothetical protein
MKPYEKDFYWMHGGLTTPQYYCIKCQHGHSTHSKIGKEHLKFKQ